MLKINPDGDHMKVLQLPTLVLLAFFGALKLSSNLHGADLDVLTADIDMTLCQGVDRYQASVVTSGTPLAVAAVNDFPFAIKIIYPEGNGWSAFPAATGTTFKLSLFDGSVLIAADAQIKMCIGALIINEGRGSGALSLAATISDFNGSDLVAGKPTKQSSKPSDAADCPDFLTGGVIWTDLGIDADKADLSSIDLEICLDQIPDGAGVPLSGDPSVITRSQDNMASTVNFRKAVNAAEFCNLMPEKEANKLEEQLKLEGVRQGLIIVLAERSIAEGQSYWIKGRDEQWNDYMKLHLETSYKVEELMQEFQPIMEKPEASGPCMCKQLNLSC